jgi:hypothetical protein
MAEPTVTTKRLKWEGEEDTQVVVIQHGENWLRVDVGHDGKYQIREDSMGNLVTDGYIGGYTDHFARDKRGNLRVKR